MMVKKGTATGLSWCLVLLVVACVFFGSAHALIHKLKIRDDPRGSFFIESFGFEAGGKLKMNFTNLKIDGGSKNLEEARAGFIIKRTSVRYHGFIDEHMTPECLFDIQNRVREPFEETIIITDFEALQREITVRVDGTSFYNVYFVSCQKPGTLISFDLDMEMYNPVLDYLSTGDSVLPTLYTFFSFVYLLTAVWWIWFYMRPGEGRQIYRIHYLMTILLLLKMAAVFFHAVEMHYLKINGHPGAWSIVYFIFALMKGVMFFVVVGLIGSGWGFIKPFLSDKDKNILLFVIPLQVIDNIALAIIEETAPGSFIWLTWVDIFRIVDIVCCVAVLAPIVWSVNHLKQASQVDGKATRNFTKLKLFQTFYLTVISFIYMTRIIVYLLDSSLNFRWTWMAVFVSEVSTLVFILCTGNMFKPVADNPFLKMDTERDVELNEFNDRDSAAEIHHPLDRDD